MVNEIQCSNSNKGGALFTRVSCQKSKLWRWLHMATTLSSLQHSSVLDPSPIHYVRATLPAKSTSCSITSLTYKLATYPDTQRSDWKRINYRITYNLQLIVIMKYFCQSWQTCLRQLIQTLQCKLWSKCHWTQRNRNTSNYWDPAFTHLIKFHKNAPGPTTTCWGSKLTYSSPALIFHFNC